jgi:hypothetical protein
MFDRLELRAMDANTPPVGANIANATIDAQSTDEVFILPSLLRVRSKRPCHRAADECNELAPLHARSKAQETALYRIKRVL